MKMTKDRYMYELIDQCMVVSCQDIILLENFELSDDSHYYQEMEEQFRDCLKFYDQMRELFDRNEINEAMMDQELRTVLALVRQKALNGLLEDFQIFLKYADIADKEEQINLLKKELQTQEVDAEYLLSKLVYLRQKEQVV